MRLFLLACLLAFCGSYLHAQGREVPRFESYDEFAKATLADEETTYVVNFWATWCAPCVQELPYFEQLHAENKNVQVVLVSLDFKNQYAARLLPFVEKHALQSKVVFLADGNYNDWLVKVDADWSGAIPATLIVRGKKRLFVERNFEDYEDLRRFVDSFHNKP